MRYVYAIPVLIACVTPAFAYDADDIVAYYLADMWHAGKSIIPGDFFTYHVCDSQSVVHECYQIRMDFYAELFSENRSYWIVQAEVTVDNAVAHYIFLLDSDTMKVHTFAGRDVARSIEETIFYLAQFASPHSPKHLKIGAVWGDVSSSLYSGDKLVVSFEDNIELQNGNTLDVSAIQYGIFEQSTFMISQDVAFPITAIAYNPFWNTDDPPVMFTFELLDYAGTTLNQADNSTFSGSPEKIQDH